MEHADERPVFDTLPRDFGNIAQYDPQFLNQGREHLVYRIPSHPRVVIKASKYKIANILYTNFSQGEIPSVTELAHRVERDYTPEIRRKNQEIRDIKNHFGKAHTLPEKRFLMKVPASREILEELFRDDYKDRKLPNAAREMREVWTHVIVQACAPAATLSGRLSFSFGSLSEDHAPDPVAYDTITKLLFKGAATPADVQAYLDILDSSPEGHLKKVLTQASKNSDLSASVCDFVRRAIGFSEATGQILALGGQDNVIFYKDKAWNYLLLDAVTPPPEPILHEVRTTISDKISRHEKLSVGEIRDLQRCANFVRVINGTAAYLGTPERIVLPDVLTETEALAIMRGESKPEAAATSKTPMRVESLERQKILNKEYFKIQMEFAKAVSKARNIPLDSALFTHTNFYRRFGLAGGGMDESSQQWQAYMAGLTRLKAGEDPVDYTFQFYLKSPPERSRPKLLFGCFSCDSPDPQDQVLRLHFANADSDRTSPLDPHKIEVRRGELKNMLQHVRHAFPNIQLVRCTTWLNSVEAFTRLFPRKYAESRIKAETQKFQGSSYWGQFLKRDGSVREDLKAIFLERLKHIDAQNPAAAFPVGTDTAEVPLDVLETFLNSSESGTRE